MNKIILMGRLTKDPEIVKTKSGVNMCKCSVVTNKRFKNKEGEKQEKATFHNIVAFSNTADFINDFFKKGNGIMLEGEQDNYQYEKEDGTKGYGNQVNVSNVEFPISNGKQEEGATKKPAKSSSLDDVPATKGGDDW